MINKSVPRRLVNTKSWSQVNYGTEERNELTRFRPAGAHNNFFLFG